MTPSATHTRAFNIRCEYSDGRSMGSTRVGVRDNGVTQICAGVPGQRWSRDQRWRAPQMFS